MTSLGRATTFLLGVATLGAVAHFFGPKDTATYTPPQASASTETDTRTLDQQQADGAVVERYTGKSCELAHKPTIETMGSYEYMHITCSKASVYGIALGGLTGTTYTFRKVSGGDWTYVPD